METSTGKRLKASIPQPWQRCRKHARNNVVAYRMGNGDKLGNLSSMSTPLPIQESKAFAKTPECRLGDGFRLFPGFQRFPQTATQ